MSLVGFKAQNHGQQTAKRGANDQVDDRGTDRAFFDQLSARFGGFDLDVAAAAHNAKCKRWYGIADDGLSQPWTGAVWCNPPYSNIGAWVQKAWSAWNGEDPRVPAKHQLQLARDSAPYKIVLLLPANRVEQAWWQDHVEPFRDRPGSPLRVEFLRGRLRFDRPGAVVSSKGDRPPFGCCLLIWESR